MLPSLQPQVMLAVIQYIWPMWSLQLIPTPVYQCLLPVLLSEPGNWTPCFLSCRCPSNAFSRLPLWCFNIQTRLPFSMFKMLWQHPIPQNLPPHHGLWGGSGSSDISPQLSLTRHQSHWVSSGFFSQWDSLHLRTLHSSSWEPASHAPTSHGWSSSSLRSLFKQAFASSGMAFLHTFS